MIALSVFCALVLVTYVVLMCRGGVPSMLSATYYRLQEHGNGWQFSLLMVMEAMAMLSCILDSGKGVPVLAFLGCAGLMLVGCAPHYADEDELVVHKTCAITAAICCVAWCLTANWLMTIVLLPQIVVIVYEEQRLFWAELWCFTDVFMTYWSVVLSPMECFFWFILKI